MIKDILEITGMLLKGFYFNIRIKILGAEIWILRRILGI